MAYNFMYNATGISEQTAGYQQAIYRTRSYAKAYYRCHLNRSYRVHMRSLRLRSMPTVEL